MAILHLTDNNFKKEILESSLPALVDFSAAWCGPCKAIGPVIEELAKEYLGRLLVGELDVEKSPRTATQYTVMSVPTLMFFKKGRVYDQSVGALSKSELRKRIEENLSEATT